MKDEEGGRPLRRTITKTAQLVLQLFGICFITVVLLSLSSTKHRSSITQREMQAARFGQPDLDADKLELGSLGGGITKLIHQSWSSETVPVKFRKWSISLRDQHPDWKWFLWTDDDNRELVMKQEPAFLTTYDSFPHHIMRADAARILYMRTYGGCYFDLDFEALKPLDELVSEVPLALASMGYESSQHNVPNAFMCSSPGHPFWRVCLETIQAKWAESQDPGTHNITGNDVIEQITGPRMIHLALQRWALSHPPVHLLEPELVYPYSWLTPLMEPRKAQRLAACHCLWGSFNAAACKAHFPDAHFVSYWCHTWESV